MAHLQLEIHEPWESHSTQKWISRQKSRLGTSLHSTNCQSGRLPGERAAGEVARLALAQPCLIPDPPASSKAASRFHFQEKVWRFKTVLGFVGSSQSFRSRGAVSVILATTLLILLFFFHTRKQLASALFDSRYSRLSYLNKTLCISAHCRTTRGRTWRIQVQFVGVPHPFFDWHL